MSTPERWLDEPRRAPPYAAELLQQGLDVEPDDAQKDAVWAALAARIGPGLGGPDGGSGPDAGGGGAPDVGSAAAGHGAGASLTAGLGATIVKAALVGAFAGLLVNAGMGTFDGIFEPSAVAPTVSHGSAPPGDEPLVARLPGPEPPRLAAPSVAVSAPVGAAPSVRVAGPVATSVAAPRLLEDEPTAAIAPAEPEGAPSLLGGPSASPPGPSSEEARRSRLREESALLGEARGALRGGDAAHALALLDAARTRFPDGILGQEREALTIEALARSGQAAAASARARAFLVAYPSSAHAERIQTFVSP